MEKNDQLKRNQNGDTPSDKPSEKLIRPPKRTGPVRVHRSNFNITGKDYKLGDRNTVR